MNLEIMLTVQQQLHRRIEQVDKLQKQQVERIAYEVELTRAYFPFAFFLLTL